MADAAYSEPNLIPSVQGLSPAAPLRWLAAGWRDLWHAPAVSLSYGLIFAASGLLLTLGLDSAHMLPWIIPLAFSFILIGPLAAVGLYDVSRRLQRAEYPTLKHALRAWAANPTQIGLMGVFLFVAMLAWLLIASILFMLFFSQTNASWANLFEDILVSSQNVPFLLTGSAIGALIGAAVFSISVVSIPMMFDRQVDAVTAMITSVQAVRRNLLPMVLWALSIGVLTALGMAAYFIGLALSLPLIGHATWHAYREVVG